MGKYAFVHTHMKRHQQTFRQHPIGIMNQKQDMHLIHSANYDPILHKFKKKS